MEKENHTSSFDDLRKNFADWDAGVPSENVWEELESDLVTDKVWNKLSQTIDVTEKPNTLKNAYDKWDVEIENDGWSKLNDSLSRERVWGRLNSSLNIPVRLPASYLKVAASFLVFMFTSFYVTNERFENTITLAQVQTSPETKQISSESLLSVTPETNLNQNLESITPIAQQITPVIRNSNEPISQPKQHDLSANNSIVQENKSIPTNETTDISSIDPLMRLHLNHFPGSIPPFDGPDFTPRSKEPNWFISGGAQLALLKERANGPLTSTTPTLGYIGELGHSFNRGRFSASQSLGFTQFTSEKGRYINGRFFTSNQKLNVAQAKVLFGFSLNKIRFNAGVNLNRIISGYESQANKITNVYDVPKMKFGFTGGMEIRLKTFENKSTNKKSTIGLGVNYQYIPKLVSKNAEFNRIEAVNLQLKYAF
jgi:hypothetical protein